jgi:hypothetical protein
MDRGMSGRRRRTPARARAAAAATLFTVCGLLLSPTAASATAQGSINGTVTAPMGTEIAATICALASSGEESCATTLASNINRNSPGAYKISSLASGTYKVRFTARCSVEPCPDTFPPKYYDNQISLAKATPVTLNGAETLDGIDASIEERGERGVREYLENERPAQPTGEGTVTQPGAVEPLPLNKKVEEEFWAHPPWARSTTPSPTTPVAGVAVAASRAAVKGASAEIPLHCAGAGVCSGLLALVAKVTEKRFVKRDGKRIAVKQIRNILMGTGRFSLAARASETVSVRLTRLGQALLRTAGEKLLEVKLTGSDVKNRVVVLTEARARKPKVVTI